MKDISVIEVRIWGRTVGAVTLDPSLAYYVFEYDPAWKKTGVELAPLQMPAKAPRSLYVFPTLPEATYFRLPALLADALPDDFGNALIDAWMAQRGIEKSSVTVLDRLAYMGKRGMGALEFRPARGAHKESSAPVEMKELVEEARRLVQGTSLLTAKPRPLSPTSSRLGLRPVALERRPSLPGIQKRMKCAVGNSMPLLDLSIGC